MTCINLRETFGQRFQIDHDEARKRGDDPWLQVIPCRYGHIYPHGGNRLGIATKSRGRVAAKLARMPGVEVVQDADDGINAVFPVELFPKIAALVKPYRRQGRSLSDAERQAASERLRQYRFSA